MSEFEVMKQALQRVCPEIVAIEWLDGSANISIPFNSLLVPNGEVELSFKDGKLKDVSSLD